MILFQVHSEGFRVGNFSWLGSTVAKVQSNNLISVCQQYQISQIRESKMGAPFNWIDQELIN